MATIDERVVGIRFDSSKFTSGIKPAVDGLDKLKSSLNMEGATKSIEELDNAGKRFSLGENLGKATDQVSGKFIAMATVAITALSNIVNKAVNAGESIVKSLTIDPVKAGLDEYELKMGSIQTILANTARYGTQLPEVTAALDDLNHYADKTIYNFGAMTKNIGLFTNAGIGITDATTMIKGFSNAAAASGTTAEGAAGAAYQLSQALSAGTIRLMDWRSLTNAGMGNKNMQDGLIGIATAMGTFSNGTATAQSASKDFNHSLEENWLSAGVMSSYLKIMAEDNYDNAKAMALSIGLSEQQADIMAKQAVTANEAATKVRTFTQLLGTMREAVGSGWSQSFEIIIGDFNEATDLFTNVNNALSKIVGDVSDARNNLLQGWADAGGRTSAIDAIASAFHSVMNIIQVVQHAFEEVFPPVTGKQLAELTKNFQKFVEAAKPSAKVLADIKSTAKGFFAILHIGATIIGSFIKMVWDLLGVVAPAGGSLLDITGNMGEWLVKVDEAITKGQGITKFFSGLGKVLKVLVGIIGFVAAAVGDLFGHTTEVANSGFDAFLERMKERLAPIGAFIQMLKAGYQALEKVGEAVSKFFLPLATAVGGVFQAIGQAISDIFTKGDIQGAMNLVNTGLLTGIGALIYKFLGVITQVVKGGLGGSGIIGTISKTFGELGNTLQAMQGQIKAKTLLTIAGAVALLTVSVVALSLIDQTKLAGALLAISTMFIQLGLAMAGFDKMFTLTDAAKLTVLSLALIGISSAMVIFAGAIAILGSMDPQALAQGIIAMGLALGIVSLAMLLLSKVGPGAILGSLALGIAAVGLLVLSAALKVFATMSWDDIGRAMTILGSTLAILAVGLTLMAATLPGSAALVIASVGILILSAALKVFGTMPWDDIGRAMTLLGSSLAILAVGLTLMVASLPGAAALVVASVGLLVLAGVLKIFATMSWEDIGQAMTALGGTLGILALGLTLMVAALPGAGALIVAAGALAILAPVLMLLGNMSWEQIWTGLGALALTLGLLAVAGMALEPAIPGLVGLGVAVAFLGIGVLAAGVGVLALSIGLTALSVAGGAAITVLIAAVSGLAGLIPYIAKQIGLGIIEIIVIIGESGPQLLVALTTLLLALVGAIVAVIPPVIDAIVLLVTKLVEALLILVPLLVDAGMKLIIGILDGIAKNLEKVIEKGTDLVVALLTGIGKALPRLLLAGAQLLIDFLNGIAETIRKKTKDIQAAGANIASAIIEGMTSGLMNGIKAVTKAAQDLANGALKAAKAVLGIKSPSREFKAIGKFSTEGFANGLIEFSHISEAAATDLGDNTIDALKKSMKDAGVVLTASGMDQSPTIRPVLDLTNVKRDAGLLGGILGSQTLAVDGATARANEIAAKYGEYQTAAAEAAGPTTEVNMVQNNYSPKALPAAEIYRQGKSQMATLKKTLEAE